MPVLEALINLIAPHICVNCGREGSLLCSECRHRLPASIPRCYQCEQPHQNGSTCRPCLKNTCLQSVQSVSSYEGITKVLIKQMKFHYGRAGAQEIASMLAQRFGKDFIKGAYTVVPVPTSRQRVRQRGYDQAALIARGFARQTHLPYASLLLRHGEQQQHGASRLVRKQQMRQAYQVFRPDRAAGRRILLIDDVVTTGATLEAAATVLMQAGAVSIDALVFAQA